MSIARWKNSSRMLPRILFSTKSRGRAPANAETVSSVTPPTSHPERGQPYGPFWLGVNVPINRISSWCSGPAARLARKLTQFNVAGLAAGGQDQHSAGTVPWISTIDPLLALIDSPEANPDAYNYPCGR